MGTSHRRALAQLCHARNMAHPTAALHATCRAVHSTPTEWIDRKREGLTRGVTRLPQGMSPFQLSRAGDAGASVTEESVSAAADAEVTLQAASHARTASSSTSTASCPLPPWPVNAFEFNARAPHGGHDIRLASGDVAFPFHTAAASSPADLAATAYLLTGMGCAVPLSAQELSAPGASASTLAASPPPALAGARTSLLTLEMIRQLQAAEEAPVAQAALRAGGWVCTQCWSVVGADSSAKRGPVGAAPHTTTLPRTVCPTCHTLRHDAHALSAVLAQRQQSGMWRCGGCGEVNARAAPQCRCCAAAQDDAAEAAVEDVVHRLTLTEEAAARPVGTVVVPRNRTARWRCPGCSEMNSLQQIFCRYCERERFDFSVLCPSCEAPRALSNALAYAGVASDSTGGAQDAASATSTSTTSALSTEARRRIPEKLFDAANCYAPYTPRLSCLHCHGPLHGGRIAWVHAGGPWWCACGVVNATSAYSCLRCRLPRVVEDASALRLLLASPPPCADAEPGSESDGAVSWDFEGCTNWMCDGCGGVNVASHQIVVEVRQSPQEPVRRMKTVHGVAACRHCGAPWHHQVLRDGEVWRCACHALNGRQDAQCTSCGLPALDGLRPDMLAFWTRGDWRCPSCGILCYRSRQRCACGAVRPATHGTAEV